MDYPGSEDEEADLEITVNENYCPRWESDQNDTKSPFVSTPPSSPRHSSTLGGSFCLGLSSSSSSQTSSTVSEDILEFGNLPGVKGKYLVRKKIGEGTFSSVYEASVEGEAGKLVALKRIYGVSSPARCAKEAKILMKIRGAPHCVHLITGIRHEDTLCLVLEHFEHDFPRTYMGKLAGDELREYMRALFTALSTLHKHNILHRDIKPSNFLYSRARREYRLIDFGLAEILTEKDSLELGRMRNRVFAPRSGFEGSRAPRAHAARAGTRGFRAPEVLMKVTNQSFGVDIWSCAIILLCLLSGRYPFFVAADDISSLAEIAALVGTKTVERVANSLQRAVTFDYTVGKVSLKEICARLNPEGAEKGDEVYSLLSRCMCVDPAMRISAGDALRHRYFGDGSEEDTPEFVE